MSVMRKERPGPDGWSRWVQPNPENYRFGCCECGLVHTLQFRVEEDRVQFRARRNERSTAAVRREAKRRSK